MNSIEIKDHEILARAAESAGKLFAQRITYNWQEDLYLRKKWNFTEEGSEELLMKEICFVINNEQIELLRPIMSEEPKCKVTFGHVNLQTLSLVLKFKLTDMKVTGTMRTYSSSKSCKSFPYELYLKDVEFEIMAGLIIRGDSFCIENYSSDYLNFNIILSYKNKDESKDIFPLDKVEDATLRKSLEKYIADKVTKDIIIAVEDRVGEECVDTSVSGMLDNEYNYRNLLRLHKKKMSLAFQKLVTEVVDLVNSLLQKNNLGEIRLPDLYGKLLEQERDRGYFKATEGSLKNLASLQQLGEITVHQEDDNIVLFVFLYFSQLEIAYKHLSINKKDNEEMKSFQTPENSNASYMKIKIQKLRDDKISLSLLDFKVDDLGYIEIDWDSTNDGAKKLIEPELAMWINYSLEYGATPIIEERIKSSLSEALKDEKLMSLVTHSAEIEDVYDSDPLDEEDDDEMDEEEMGEEDEDDDCDDDEEDDDDDDCVDVGDDDDDDEDEDDDDVGGQKPC